MRRVPRVVVGNNKPPTMNSKLIVLSRNQGPEEGERARRGVALVEPGGAPPRL